MRRVASAVSGRIEVLKAPSGGGGKSGVVRKVSPPQPTSGSGERCEHPSGIRGRVSAGNAFWSILQTTKRYTFCTFMPML